MTRRTPALVRAKDIVIDLSDEDQDALLEWLELFLEVRDQEKERRLKKAQATVSEAKVKAE